VLNEGEKEDKGEFLLIAKRGGIGDRGTRGGVILREGNRDGHANGFLAESDTTVGKLQAKISKEKFPVRIDHRLRGRG